MDRSRSKREPTANRRTLATVDGRPTVSVIVPVYNDPPGLAQTVAALTSQTYPAEAHEIVIVDNGSTDRTPAVAREATRSSDHVRVVVEDEVQGSYAARNEGIRRATGEVLAFVDADVLVEPDWLESAIDAMEVRDAAYLGCAVEMIGDDESLVGTYNLHTGFPIEYFVAELGFAPTCSLLVRRVVIDDVGPFDPRLRSGGDREFGHRVRDAGWEIHVAEEVTAYHPTRTTLESLLGKSRRIGRGYYKLRELYPDRYGSRLRCALNPSSYVPPRPDRIRRSIEDWEARSRRERAGFYLLSYARGVMNGIGRLEAAARRRG